MCELLIAANTHSVCNFDLATINIKKSVTLTMTTVEKLLVIKRRRVALCKARK